MLHTLCCQHDVMQSEPGVLHTLCCQHDAMQSEPGVLHTLRRHSACRQRALLVGDCAVVGLPSRWTLQAVADTRAGAAVVHKTYYYVEQMILAIRRPCAHGLCRSPGAAYGFLRWRPAGLSLSANFDSGFESSDVTK